MTKNRKGPSPEVVREAMRRLQEELQSPAMVKAIEEILNDDEDEDES